jgi:hypothetical protein
VGRTILILDIAVIPATLVLIFDQKANGRACGAPFKDPRQNADLVWFPALGGVARLARPAAIEIALNERFIER